MPEDGVEQIELLSAVEDLHGGVVVDLKEVMDSEVFSSLLRASMSQWKQKVLFVVVHFIICMYGVKFVKVAVISESLIYTLFT